MPVELRPAAKGHPPSTARAEMMLSRFRRDRQSSGDLGVGQPFHHEIQDLELASFNPKRLPRVVEHGPRGSEQSEIQLRTTVAQLVRDAVLLDPSDRARR